MGLSICLTLSASSSAYSLPKGLGNSFGNYMLHGIEEIHLPQVVSWWPQAIGWNIILVLFLFWLSRRVYKMIVKWNRNHYRRYALENLEQLEKDAQTGSDQVLRQLPALLKNTALQAYPREQIASLSGPAWLAWLDSTMDEPIFCSSIGQRLLSISYQAEHSWQLETDQRSELFELLRRWIRQHRAAEQGGANV